MKPIRRGTLHEVPLKSGGTSFAVYWSDADRNFFTRRFRDESEARAHMETLPYLVGRTVIGKISNRTRVDATTGCWEVSGSIASNGYPHVSDGRRKKTSTHRAMFEAWYGPIPDGLVLDHICRNTRCANPEHLEPVTNGENVRRGISADATRARYAAQTECKRGHPLSGDNIRTFIARNGSAHRTCKMCSADGQRRRRAAI